MGKNSFVAEVNLYLYCFLLLQQFIEQLWLLILWWLSSKLLILCGGWVPCLSRDTLMPPLMPPLVRHPLLCFGIGPDPKTFFSSLSSSVVSDLVYFSSVSDSMSDPLPTGKSSLSSNKSKRLSWDSCVIIAAVSSAEYHIDLKLCTL